MHTLYKPNGKAIQVNDNSLEYGLSIGWTKEDPTVEPVFEPKKKTNKKDK